MADQRGSSAKIIGPVVAIGIIVYIGLFMTGHTAIAMPLFWGLVIFGLVFGRRAKKNRANLGSGEANRTATFPGGPPAASAPLDPTPEPAGHTFPTPQPAAAPSVPKPEPAPAVPEPPAAPPAASPPPPVAVPALESSSEATAPSPEVVAQVAELKKSGRTVDAIEALREATGMELYEASQYVRKL